MLVHLIYLALGFLAGMAAIGLLTVIRERRPSGVLLARHKKTTAI